MAVREESSLIRSWVQVGIGAGLAVSLIYPALILAPLPPQVALVLALSFGLLLAVASVGLYHMLAVHQRSVSLQMAVASNVIAGLVVNMMFLVQMATRNALEPAAADIAEAPIGATLLLLVQSIDRVQLGLDVLWDVYIALGTALFALNMWRHPRFGPIFALIGFVIAALLLALNLASFPIPPAQAGLFDIGPALGLWYLAVTIQILRSLAWLDGALSGRPR